MMVAYGYMIHIEIYHEKIEVSAIKYILWCSF
jgi:hypothetical protein